jgi:geranylgeranyl diphosphate synthase, type I
VTDRLHATAASDASLGGSLAQIREEVDLELTGFLAKERGDLQLAHPGAAALVAEIERVVRSGGKRIRPILAAVGHRAGGGRVERPIVRAAASMELLHTFAIIHDDVMDGTPVRRGTAATQRLLGVPVAVLVGDMALALADHMLLSSGFEDEVLGPAVRRYTKMKVQLGVGQYLDLTADAGLGEDAAIAIATLKSGSYTVDGPLAVGAILARGSNEVLRALAGFADPLGRAFQVRDDLLGAVRGNGGAAQGLDLRPSIVLARARVLAVGEDLAFLDGLAGARQPGEEDRARYREILIRSGAAAFCVRMVNDLVGRAVRALRGSPLPPDVATDLGDLAASISLDPTFAKDARQVAP